MASDLYLQLFRRKYVTYSVRPDGKKKSTSTVMWRNMTGKEKRIITKGFSKIGWLRKKNITIKWLFC
jgi:hypothetical protein